MQLSLDARRMGGDIMGVPVHGIRPVRIDEYDVVLCFLFSAWGVLV